MIMEFLKRQSKINFGAKLKEALKRSDIKQYQLAEKLGVEPPNVSRWVSGKHFPDSDNFEKLCSILEVEASYFTETESVSTPQSIKELSKIIADQEEQIKELESKSSYGSNVKDPDLKIAVHRFTEIAEDDEQSRKELSYIIQKFIDADISIRKDMFHFADGGLEALEKHYENVEKTIRKYARD